MGVQKRDLDSDVICLPLFGLDRMAFSLKKPSSNMSKITTSGHISVFFICQGEFNYPVIIKTIDVIDNISIGRQ